MKLPASASLDIPSRLNAYAGGAYEQGTRIAGGTDKEKTVENVSWTSIGGSPQGNIA